MGVRIYFAHHARERMRQRKGIEPTPEVVEAIKQAVAEDIKDWPEGETAAELEVVVDGLPMRLVVEKTVREKYNYSIKTVMFKKEGSPHLKRKKAYKPSHLAEASKRNYKHMARRRWG
jgi:predicted alpha-1,6-mannanase (GH76 family)